MVTRIHPQAIVETSAKLDEGIKVGPYAIVKAGAKIKKGTEIGAFAQVLNNTEIGENCKISSYAVIGSPPQDLKYKGEKSFLIIGDNNIIREFVTINPGTEEGSKTTIGNNNLIMAYSHIAHNCVVGSDNVFANAATLAGHVVVEDKVVIGGLVAIHQFCKVGILSIVGGCSKVVQDIPPFSLCDGHPAKIKGINIVGLRRVDFPKDKISSLRKAFKILFFDSHPLGMAKEIIKDTLPRLNELDYLIEFVSSSQRGISR